MFRGRFLHTLDSKYRVSIPVGYRMEIQRRNELPPILTIGKNCLALYAHDDWVAHEKSLTEADHTRPESNALQRLLIANCVESPIDSQGRILIPEFLREHAKLGKDVTLAGVGKRIEIWDRARFDEELARALNRFDEIL